MPKPYSLDLRERVLSYVDEGDSRRAAAAHFKVSVSFVVNLVKAFRVRGSLPPNPAADAATPSSNRIGRFFCRRSPKRPTSPCRSWRPNWPLRPARRPIPPRFPVGSSAPPPSKLFAPRALGSYSFRPIAPTSIRSRWLSQS